MAQEPYSYSTPPPTSGMAIISLISSIAGLTILPTIGSIIGLILGYMAKRQIVESRGATGGSGLAQAGIIIGWIGIALAMVGICIAAAIFLSAGGITACALLGNSY